MCDNGDGLSVLQKKLDIFAILFLETVTFSLKLIFLKNVTIDKGESVTVYNS